MAGFTVCTHEPAHTWGTCPDRERPPCDHHESLWGRCAACGMTWQQQADAMEIASRSGE